MSQESPSVSVIIPAFNAEGFIAEAVQSVLGQQCGFDVEILVIDDGSSDKTAAVVRSMSGNNSNVHLLSNVRTKGPSGARNTGLLHRKGEYVAFLDADDTWQANHLQLGINFLKHQVDVDVVFFDFEIRDESNAPLGTWFSARSFKRKLVVEKLEGGFFRILDDVYRALLDESFMHLQSMISRSSCIGDLLFDEEVRRSEDRDFAIRLAVKRNATFAYRDTVTGIYFHRAESLTSDSDDNGLATALDHIKLFSKYLSYPFVRPDTAAKLRTLLLDRHLAVSYYLRRRREHARSVSWVCRSFRYGTSRIQLRELAKCAIAAAYWDDPNACGRT